MESLREAFEAMPDYRVRHKYSLAGLLTLVSLAMLCGCNGEREMARWSKNHRWEFAERLGFANHKMPSLGTLQRLLRQLDAEQFAKVVGEWGQSALAAYGYQGWQGVAIDGKTVHGSKTQDAPAVHLLSALSQELNVVLGQVGVDKKTNEIKAILPLLADLVLEGRVVTVDALLTQREIAATIVEKKGQYLMPVKENQPNLFAAIQVWFEQPLPLRGLDKRQATQTNKAHGRLETRTLQATTELNQYLDWPGLQQVLRLERRYIQLNTGQISVEVRYGITSLSPQQADAPALLQLWRDHWMIENRLHWLRDVLFCEDDAKISRGNAPAVLACFRNLVISVLYLCGYSSIVAARDFYAAHPNHALALLHRSVSDWFE